MMAETASRRKPLFLTFCQLARPRLLPLVLMLPLAGFGWAHWDRALDLRGGPELLCVLAAWTALQTGTLWLNAALDRDQGEVLLGRAVAVPHGIVSLAYLALLLGVCLAFLGNRLAGCAAAICGVLAVLYSHPRTVWKGRPVLGPLVNGAGYGLLTPLAGWATVQVAPDTRTLVVWPLAALAVVGCYFAAQTFQRDEDRARGYRTLVVTHGPRATLLAARVCIGLALLGGTALAAIGWLPRLCLVALPLGWWVDRWLRRWSMLPHGGDERWARGLALRLLVAGLVGVGLAYVDYGYALLTEGPAAGLATVSGHPSDSVQNDH
jgi:4-hydroxybenzoate polyprenyltransferase